MATVYDTVCAAIKTALDAVYAPLTHTHTKSEVTDFPSTMAPSSHTHGNLTNEGKLGSTSGKPVITTTGGAITTGAFGTSSGQFAEGNHTHTGYASSSHNHNLSDLNNMEAVQVTVTFTDNTTATYKLVRYTGS